MGRFVSVGMLCVSLLVTGSAQAASSKKKAADSQTAPTPSQAAPAPSQTSPSNSAPDLDFDLLPPPNTTDENQPPPIPKLTPEQESAVHTRRLMLTMHQTVGFALAAAEAGAIITGQLNYSDKFGGSNSGRYELPHQVFVYSTLTLGAITGGLAVFAPVPIEKKTGGFDRMTLHKIGLFTAAAGWAAELGLGLYTSSREGFANQQSFAAAHLAIGYLTLAGLMLGVGAITF